MLTVCTVRLDSLKTSQNQIYCSGFLAFSRAVLSLMGLQHHLPAVSLHTWTTSSKMMHGTEMMAGSSPLSALRLFALRPSSKSINLCMATTASTDGKSLPARWQTSATPIWSCLMASFFFGAPSSSAVAAKGAACLFRGH